MLSTARRQAKPYHGSTIREKGTDESKLHDDAVMIWYEVWHSAWQCTDLLHAILTHVLLQRLLCFECLLHIILTPLLHVLHCSQVCWCRGVCGVPLACMRD